MRAIEKKYFDKYAIDPFSEDFMFDSLVEGWADDFANEEPESIESCGDDWDDLV